MNDTKEPSIVNLMSNMKREVKRLSHNELARNFVNIYTQYILAQRELEYLTKKLNELNKQSGLAPENNSVELPESAAQSETK